MPERRVRKMNHSHLIGLGALFIIENLPDTVETIRRKVFMRLYMIFIRHLPPLLLYYTKLFTAFFKLQKRKIKLLAGVSSHKTYTYQAIIRRASKRNKTIHKNTLILQRPAHVKGVIIPQPYRNIAFGYALGKYKPDKFSYIY
jgi:hypothetical protein